MNEKIIHPIFAHSTSTHPSHHRYYYHCYTLEASLALYC
jgi:hypothetical protein